MISWFGKSERDIIEGIVCEFNNLFLVHPTFGVKMFWKKEPNEQILFFEL